MEDKKPEESFEVGRVAKRICMLCECPIGIHVSFWSCPIFNNYDICAECCHSDALRSGIEDKFSKRLGRTITREDINRMCGDCGKNHAVQSDEIADRIVFNSYKAVIDEEKEDERSEEHKKDQETDSD